MYVMCFNSDYIHQGARDVGMSSFYGLHTKNRPNQRSYGLNVCNPKLWILRLNHVLGMLSYSFIEFGP